MSESIKRFFEQVDQVAEAGERVAIATIARTKGSTPREAGAKMIIRSAGQALGTIGGGCGEAEVWRTALDVIADGKARMVHVDLTEEISLKSEGVCGGTLDVFVDPWGPEQRGILRGGALGPGHEAELELLPAIEERVPVTLATVIERRRAPEVLIGGKILVRTDGTLVGSLGSAALEALVVPDAVAALQQEQPRTLTYRLGEGEAPATVDVLLEPFGRRWSSSAPATSRSRWPRWPSCATST